MAVWRWVPTSKCVTCNAKFGFCIARGTCVNANCLSAARIDATFARRQSVVKNSMCCWVSVGFDSLCDMSGRSFLEFKQWMSKERIRMCSIQAVCTACDLFYVLDTEGKKCVSHLDVTTTKKHNASPAKHNMSSTTTAKMCYHRLYKVWINKGKLSRMQPNLQTIERLCASKTTCSSNKQVVFGAYKTTNSPATTNTPLSTPIHRA